MTGMVRALNIMSGLDGGGVENIFLNYYRKMDHEKVVSDIIVHSPHKGKLEDEFEKMGCKIYHVTPKTVSLRKNIAEIYHIMKTGKYDVVHSRMNVKGVTHILSAWLCGIKVRMIHTHMAYMPMRGKMKVLAPIAKKVCKMFATHWLACSEDAAIEMFGEKEVKEGKVIILNNAIELEKFRYNKEVRKKIRKEFGLDKEYVIGMVGRFHEQKNHEFMLKVFRSVLKKSPDAKLMLVGGGELYEDICSEVERTGMQDNVIFTGIRSDVPALLQAMDVFVLPTKYEGFGNVLIEAQAAGLHTITSVEGVPKSTKVTELIEYVSLHEPEEVWADKILEYENDRERKDVSRQIQQAGFDVDTEVKKFENLYVNAANETVKK